MVDHTDAGEQRYDAGVGLYHFLYRAYSPSLGRWLRCAPAGFVDGLNLYEYVSGSPLNFVDPHGLFIEVFDAVVNAACDAADAVADAADAVAEEVGYTIDAAAMMLGTGETDLLDELAVEVNENVDEAQENGFDQLSAVASGGLDTLVDAVSNTLDVAQGDMSVTDALLDAATGIDAKKAKKAANSVASARTAFAKLFKSANLPRTPLPSAPSPANSA